MSEEEKRTTSRTDEQTHESDEPSPWGPQMRQAMAKMMDACGCCAEMVRALTGESRKEPRTCC